MISIRTKLSLAQFLELQNHNLLVLLQKHSIDFELLEQHGIDSSVLQERTFRLNLGIIAEIVNEAADNQIRALLDEIVLTQLSLRYQVSPKYLYEERWADLQRCLQLDGYLIKKNQIVLIDPSIEEGPPLEDDLIQSLKLSGLAETSDILQKLRESTESFRRTNPNYNACLNDARVALETLAKSIARRRQLQYPSSLDESKWGAVIQYLRSSGLITLEEEKGLAGVFAFLSPGSHQPIGLSDEEMARLGRSLSLAMCYFLIRRAAGK